MFDSDREDAYRKFCHRLSSKLTLDRPLEVAGIDVPLVESSPCDLIIKPIWEVTDEDKRTEIKELRKIAYWFRDYLLYCLVDHFFSDFPSVCDISARFTSDYFARLYHHRFRVFEVIGEYKHAYHCWTILVSTLTGVQYYVDFTSIQFMRKYMREEGFIKPNGDYGYLLSFRWLAGSILAHKKISLPCPIIPISELKSNYSPYNPIEYYRVVQQGEIGKPFLRSWQYIRRNTNYDEA